MNLKDYSLTEKEVEIIHLAEEEISKACKEINKKYGVKLCGEPQVAKINGKYVIRESIVDID
jgi:hypothetical protein